MNSIKSAIPNSLTLGNLACGVLGIIWVFEGSMIEACYLIWLAATLDFFDGFVARLLKVTSEIGKQLDSLADLVTFGVLPSLIYYQLLQNDVATPWLYLTLSTALLSGLRLAKFNTDESQKVDFKGLTTTANGILTSAIPLILAKESLLTPFFANTDFLLAFCLLFSLLLVTPVTLFSLKFSNFKFRGNEARFALIVISLTLITVYREVAIPLIIVCYLLLSVLNILLTHNKKSSV